MTKRVPLRRTVDEAAVQAARQKVQDAQAELEALEDDGGDDNAVHVHIHNGAATVDGALKKEEPTAAKTFDARLTTLETGLGNLMKMVQKAVGIKGKTADKKRRGRDEEEMNDPDEEEDITTDESSEEDEEEEEDKDKKKTEDEASEEQKKTATQDSKALATGYQALMAQAEILSPGFKMPTFDATAKRAVTIDRMCQVRRKVLHGLDPNFLTVINGGKPYDGLTMDCMSTAVLFKAAAGAKAAANNATATRDSATLPKKEEQGPKRQSLADINKANAEYWKGH